MRELVVCFSGQTRPTANSMRLASTDAAPPLRGGAGAECPPPPNCGEFGRALSAQGQTGGSPVQKLVIFWSKYEALSFDQRKARAAGLLGSYKQLRDKPSGILGPPRRFPPPPPLALAPPTAVVLVAFALQVGSPHPPHGTHVPFLDATQNRFSCIVWYVKLAGSLHGWSDTNTCFTPSPRNVACGNREKVFSASIGQRSIRSNVAPRPFQVAKRGF
jgi:hypothetical protein